MLSAKIPIEQFPYAGWIPTVNGRLSFRHIGESRHPTETIYANVTNANGRMILGYQHRPLSDALFQTIIHYFCDISGDFWFVLAARSDEEPSSATEMQGYIAIYKSRQDWRTHESKVRESVIKINELRFALSPHRDRDISGIFSRTQASVNSSADIRVGFHLFRSGEVFFSEPAFRDAELDFASNNYASAGGHDFKKWVCDQSYFFLRDVSHTHQHHVASSDTILILQKRDPLDIDWRRRIIFSLYHQVIKSKRYGDAPSAYQSLGIQAYCMSFREVCALQTAWKSEHFPKFNDAALMQSLEARAQEELARHAEQSRIAQVKLAKAANWRTFALALVAIIIAALAILVQPRISVDEAEKFPKLMAWSEFAARQFDTVLACCLTALCVVWVLTQASWAAKNLPYARDLLEISNIRKRRFVQVYFVASIIAALLTAWTAKLAIYDITDAFRDFLKLVL